MLEEAAAGHVFAAGHGEPGNDVPIFLSTTQAERVPGGWEFSGHKDLRQPLARLDLHRLSLGIDRDEQPRWG